MIDHLYQHNATISETVSMRSSDILNVYIKIISLNIMLGSVVFTLHTFLLCTNSATRTFVCMLSAFFSGFRRQLSLVDARDLVPCTFPHFQFCCVFENDIGIPTVDNQQRQYALRINPPSSRSCASRFLPALKASIKPRRQSAQD